MRQTKKTKNTPRWVPLLLGVLVVLIVMAAGGYLYTLYAFVDGEFMRTDLETLDLRDRGLTDLRVLRRFEMLQSADLRGNNAPLEEYEYLREKLPDSELRFDVPLGDQVYDSLLTELHLDDLPEDWENIRLFSSLRSLTVDHCTNPAAIEALRDSLPECDMSWNLCLGGEWYPSTVTALRVESSSVYYEELLSQLSWFHNAESVEVIPTVLSPAQQRSLLGAYPKLRFAWPVNVGEAYIGNDAESLTYSITGADSTLALDGTLDLLGSLRSVDFTGSKVPARDRLAFREAHPELAVSWTVLLRGVEYPCNTQALDFNGVALGSLDELESVLPFLPDLQKVEMCDCGFSNEEMDALCKRWENIRFIWNVRFAGFTLRTDATYFCASMDGLSHPYLTNSDTEVFKYLVDMQAMDIGHMYITDISFLQYMPHMTYLIIAECYIEDFTPLGWCKELLYLEAFNTSFHDMTPLLNCPRLRDLNLCYTRVSAKNARECLPQMKSLERVWWCNCPLGDGQIAELKEEYLPDCIFFTVYGGEPSGGAWRYHQNYYEMRDFFHMYYMPGGTNGVDKDGAQIVVDDRGKEFHLFDFDGGQYWWTEEKYASLGWYPYIIGVTA